MDDYGSEGSYLVEQGRLDALDEEFGSAEQYHAQVTAQLEQEEQAMDTDKISAAMAKAFPAIEGAVKGKVNPAFRSKYADLSAVTDAIKPHLEPHGLCYRQVLGRDADGVTCETIIMHASGQSVGNGQTYVPVTKKDAHGYAAAYTYARRISLQAAFGVPAEDSDGNDAVGIPAARKASVAPSDDHEAATILGSLREAAMDGTDTLNERFRKIPASDTKRAVWNDHGPQLKAVAAKADDAKATA